MALLESGSAYMDDSLQRLIERTQQGDRDAREQLLVRNLARLRSFVRLRLGAKLRAHQDSEDIVQSVCRSALADLSNVKVETEAAFRHWLFRAAENKLTDQARYWGCIKRDAEQLPISQIGEHEILDAYACVCTPSRNVAAREELARIERAFNQLPQSYREVIVLARIEGMAAEEMARELDQSPAYVRTLLSRALARLSTLLERNDA